MRRAIAIGLAAVLLFVLSFGSLLSVSYYRRWQASRLLAVVRQFHPGTTTEVQARALLRPFTEYEDDSDQQRRANEVGFTFENSPEWHPLRSTLPWTLFTVRLDFVGGLVAQMNLTEMQVDHPGYPHPNSASVDIYSNRLRQLPASFVGYSDASHTTRGIDSQGRWTSFECCHARSIKLDERATPAQLSNALNFRLSCMTSFARCKDDRQILP
jgi:hypothetical protein